MATERPEQTVEVLWISGKSDTFHRVRKIVVDVGSTYGGFKCDPGTLYINSKQVRAIRTSDVLDV